MHKALLIVKDQQRWLTRGNYEYFRPRREYDTDGYLAFLFHYFPFETEDKAHRRTRQHSIPVFQASYLDERLTREARHQAFSFGENDLLWDDIYPPDWFIKSPGSPLTIHWQKWCYYTTLTRLRYDAGMDKGIIPNLDNLYRMEPSSHQIHSREVMKGCVGGLFYLEFESTSDDSFFYDWMVEGTMEKGEIQFYREEEEVFDFKIKFWDCYCVETKEVVSPNSHSPMLMRVLLSPGITLNRGELHEKIWKISDITNEKENLPQEKEIRSSLPSPVYYEEEEEPALISVEFKDIETNETVTEYPNDEKIIIFAETIHASPGDEVNFKVYSDNGEPPIELSGKVNGNNQVEVKGVHILREDIENVKKQSLTVEATLVKNGSSAETTIDLIDRISGIIIVTPESLGILQKTLPPEVREEVKIYSYQGVNYIDYYPIYKLQPLPSFKTCEAFWYILERYDFVELHISGSLNYKDVKGNIKNESDFFKEAVNHVHDTWFAMGGNKDFSGQVVLMGNVMNYEEFREEMTQEFEEIMVESTVGVTLYPLSYKINEVTGYHSTTDYNQVIVNSNCSPFQKIQTMAHELYGHAYFKIQGKRHSHGISRDIGVDDCNNELEQFLKDTENEMFSYN